jgi:hypothetical protein
MSKKPKKPMGISKPSGPHQAPAMPMPMPVTNDMMPESPYHCTTCQCASCQMSYSKPM